MHPSIESSERIQLSMYLFYVYMYLFMYLCINLGGSIVSGKDELSAAIVDLVRLQRHEGMRVLISTQSPLSLPSEVLELCSVAVLHHFQSADWYRYLSGKLCLPEGGFAQVQQLRTGEAMIASTKMDLRRIISPDIDPASDASGSSANNSSNSNATTWIKAKIRRRITKDLGATKSHEAARVSATATASASASSGVSGDIALTADDHNSC